MEKFKTFKPNLIPNNPKDDSFSREDRDKVIEGNGGFDQYLISQKKDGCRMELGLGEKILTRSLKEPKSILVQQRFQALNQLCLQMNIVLEGEFYAHGMKFNEIFSFFSNTDVTRDDYKSKLQKLKDKDPKKFVQEYGNRSIEFLTTFHDDLKFYAFDGIVLDRPDLVNFEDRIVEIEKRLSLVPPSAKPFLVNMYFETAGSSEELQSLYEDALSFGFEGLVLTHKRHIYKFGRNSLTQGTILKMKDDALEYDGIIIDIPEGTISIEGTEKTTNELGRSVTSKKKDDRQPSGKAKAFTIMYCDESGQAVGTFDVGLRGFDDQAKAQLLKDKAQYIGRHFKYKAMAPVKDFPRHAYFDCWRDEK